MGSNRSVNSYQIRLLVYYSCQLLILYNTWILKLIQSTNITKDYHYHHHHPISRIRRQILESSSGKASEVAALKATIATIDGSELTQISYQCIVYDETPANRILLDEITTNTCQLLSRQQIIQLKLQKIQLFNIKVITTANPLAKYLKIDANNYTLMTVQHVDREELCSSNSLTDTQLTTSLDSLRVCCINRMKECIFPLNILVQIGIGKEDITGILGTDTTTTLSNTTSTTTTTTTSSSSINSLRSKFFTLQIKLIDINDNPPKFPNSLHTVHISEGIHIGSRLPLPLAEDLDSLDYNIVRYQLITQGDDTFELVQLSSEFPSLPMLSSTSSNQPAYSSSNSDYYNNLLPYGQVDSSYTAYHPSSSRSLMAVSQHHLQSLPQQQLQQTRPEQLYLKVAKQLDWETKRSYNFILTAEDNGSPAFTGQMNIEIIVTDENDNHPVFRNKSLVVYVPENSPEGVHLIQLIADDPDDGISGQVVYSLVNQGVDKISNNNNNNDNNNNNNSDSRKGLFEIDSKTGWLMTRGRLDYEKAKHHLIRVLARDQSGHPGFDEAIVSVFVTDVNDVPPQITVESVSGIASSKAKEESQENRKNVLQLYINETPGPINQISSRMNTNFDSYNLEDVPLSSTMTQLLAFVVVSDPDTGQGGNFQCHLEAVSMSNSNTNRNHKNYQSASHSSSLREINRLDKLFYSPQHLLDNEQKMNRFSQQFPGNSQSSIVGGFQLNPISSANFELITLGGFDYEFSQLESVRIVCIDNGEPSLTSSHLVKVFVQDLNDNQPIFSKGYYNFAVQENSAVNTFVNKVIASDADSGKNAEIKYQINNEGKEFFNINQLDGSIYTNLVFDRELRQNYRFQVFACDHGQPTPLTATTTVEINILDVNDNTPVFVGLDRDDAYHFRIAENQPANTYVGILLGTDADIDENAELRFRLVGSSLSFRVNQTTGELTSLQSLDREKQTNYELIVLLMDKGKPPRSATAKIHIHVTDTNDHDPIVVFPVHGKGNVSVSFREPPGEVVARIEARDPDEGHNALLHFILYSGNQASVFRLGSTSAELIIDRELTEQDIGTYPLVIHIQDSGIPSRTTEVKFMVQVTDSPPRAYSHRFTSQHENPTGEDISSLSLQRRFKDNNNHYTMNEQGKLIRVGEQYSSNPDENFISAGSILISIVALSCAIILVLLGITVYVCGRRGFQSLRYHTNRNNNHNNSNNYRTQYLTRNPNSINSLHKITDEKLHWKTILNSNHNSHSNIHTPNLTLYPNRSILIDKDSGNLLHCHIDSTNNSTVMNNAEDYIEGQTESIRLTPLNIIEQGHGQQEKHSSHHEGGYTTFLPLSEHSSNCLTNYTSLPLDEKHHSMYIPLQISPLMLNDQLKQNCEKYWTLKDSHNSYSASAENQYDQRLVSFIASKGYQCLRQAQNQSSENDSREEQYELNDKSIDTTVTETNSNTTTTITTITATTANNNTNTNAPIETNDIVNSNITSKYTPAYHTRSLKCKKSDKALQIMNELCVMPDHLIETTHNGHCTLNNNRHCLNDDSRKRSSNLKSSKSCEYIFIPHINHSSSPPVSSNRKNRDHTSPRLDANVTIFTDPNDTHKDPWNSLLQTNKATGSLFDSPTTSTTSTVTTSQQTSQILNSNNTLTTSKPSDYYTKLQQINNNNSNLQEKIKSNAKHLNSSMIYFNNSKNSEDCYSYYQAPPPVSSCIQSVEGKNQSNQSITPINLIDLMNDKCGINYTTTVCKCGGTFKDKTPTTSNNNSNNSNITAGITNNSNHDNNNNGSLIHMVRNHRHHHLHHNPHQHNAQHQHQYDNSTIPTDFV